MSNVDMIELLDECRQKHKVVARIIDDELLNVTLIGCPEVIVSTG